LIGFSAAVLACLTNLAYLLKTAAEKYDFIEYVKATTEVTRTEICNWKADARKFNNGRIMNQE